MPQLNLRVKDELAEILDTFIKEKKKLTGIDLARNTLVTDSIYKLIDVSSLGIFTSNTDFVNFDSCKYDFLNFTETKALIDSLVCSKTEMVISRFKKQNYATKSGLHTSSILALPDVIEEVEGDFRIPEKILQIAIYQIIDLDGDIEAPKLIVFRQSLSKLMNEPQNHGKQTGYYYFEKE